MLDIVGLDATAHSVYSALLRGPATVAELAEATPLPQPSVRDTLDRLEAKGLVNRMPGAPRRYRAAPPDVALDVLLLEQEERLKRARASAERLAALYHEANAGRHPAELMEIITGRTAIMQRFDQLFRGTREEFRGIDRPPYATPPGGGEHAAEWEILDRGVTVRVIYDTAGLDGPNHTTEEVYRDMARGENARVLAGTPIKLGLFDNRYGLVPLETEPAALESIVIIHRSALLAGLSVLFETLWEHALPLDVQVSAPGGPTAEEAALLRFLVAGLPDESAARQLGVSYSTLQRRLRKLMTRLGATTRFQAGLRAAHLGWLPDNHLP